MNCAEFEEILHDLDRPGTPGLSQREAALAHAESCESCGRMLTESEALDFGLHTLALQDAPTQAPLRVEAALLREFRRESNGGGREANRRYAVVIGIAAVALLVVGLLWARMALITNRSEPMAANGTASNGTVSTQASTQPEANSANQAQLNEFATAGEEAFVPLPYADDDASLEGGAVIRVDVPRSALASWGLPVSGMAGTERIPAELLVDADGTPQAIRLISEND